MNAMDNPLRILIVDDSPTASLFLQYKLDALAKTKINIYVRVSNSGEDALACFWDSGFDLVILDVVLPGMDGYEVCRKIKGSCKTRVAFLTALTSDEEEKRGFSAGCDHYIKKPATDENLLQLMKISAMSTDRGALPQ